MELMNKDLIMTSLEIAELTGKRHTEVLRDIRSEIESLENEDICTESIFALSDYKDKTGRTLPMYSMGREGAMQIATRYSATIRRKVILRLDELERLNTSKQLSTEEMIIMQAKSVLEVKNKVVDLESKFEEMNHTMSNLITLESGKQRCIQLAVAKKVYSIDGYDTKKLFSNIYRDIKRKFGVSSYKDIKTVEYEKAISFINSWIEDKI